MKVKTKPGDIIERDGVRLEIIAACSKGYRAIYRNNKKEYDNCLDPFFENGWKLLGKKSNVA